MFVSFFFRHTVRMFLGMEWLERVSVLINLEEPRPVWSACVTMNIPEPWWTSHQSSSQKNWRVSSYDSWTRLSSISLLTLSSKAPAQDSWPTWRPAAVSVSLAEAFRLISDTHQSLCCKPKQKQMLCWNIKWCHWAKISRGHPWAWAGKFLLRYTIKSKRFPFSPRPCLGHAHFFWHFKNDGLSSYGSMMWKLTCRLLTTQKLRWHETVERCFNKAWQSCRGNVNLQR